MRGDFVRADGDPAHRCALTLGALLVDHPTRGMVLVDAGLPGRPTVADRALAAVLTGRVRDDGLRSVPEVLREHGLTTGAVSQVVLTHLHWDHTGATPAFKRARVLVGPGEVAAASRGDLRRVGYYGAGRVLRHGVGEVAMHAWDEGGADFPRAHDLFGDGAILLLPAPGHTPGHLAVLVRTDPPLLYLGDAAYSLGGLRDGVPNGRLHGLPADLDRRQSVRTLAAIAGLEARMGGPGPGKLRLLPAHDAAEWQALPAFPSPIDGRITPVASRPPHPGPAPARTARSGAPRAR